MEETVLFPEIQSVPPAYPTLKESWAALGWWILIMVLVCLALLMIIWFVGKPSAVSRICWSFAATCAANLLTVWWMRHRSGSARWLGIRWLSNREHWQLYALLPVIVIASATVLSLQSLLHLPNWAASQLKALSAHPWLALVMGCVAGPVIEELVCRGVLLRGLLRNYRPSVAIVQSALLFGIMHINPSQSVNAFFIGLLFGWVYYQSQSLLLCCCLHGLYNALAFSSMYFNNAFWQSMQHYLGNSYYLMLVAMGALVLTGALWLLRYQVKAAFSGYEVLHNRSYNAAVPEQSS